MNENAITPPPKKYIPLLRKEQGFGIIDALNLSDAQSVFYGFLQAAWLGSRMARKRGFAINSIVSVHFCFGKWLCPKTLDKPHGFEIESVKVTQ